MSNTSAILLVLFAAWFVGVLALDLWLIARERLAACAEELGDVMVLDRENGPYRTGER